MAVPTCISSLTGLLMGKGAKLLMFGFVLAVALFVYVEYTPFKQSPLQQLLSKNSSEQDILEQIRKHTTLLPDSTEVSIVTAYFDLGVLEKWDNEGQRTPARYRRWMSTFARLDNPLVVFTDTKETIQNFQQLRAHYPPSRTSIISVNRSDLWAFQLANQIQIIFSQKGYPSHAPNTINPLYSCAMHAKYELVQRVVLEELYQTRFIAWLDIGYFRDEVHQSRSIHLTVPTDFNRAKVAFSQVNPFLTMTPGTIIKQNMVWTAGGAFLATPERMYVYCSQYREAVEKLMDMNWMSTDQQVIYSMFQPSFNFTRRFELQAYRDSSGGNPWFTLGYLMMKAP